MASMLPMAMFGLEIPAGDIPIPASTEIQSAFRITMAAIDPSAEPEGAEEGKPSRATLKVIRQSLLADESDEDEDSEEFDADEMERMLGPGSDSEDDEDKEVNGGPSDPSKTKKAREAKAREEMKKSLDDNMDVDVMVNGTNGVIKSEKAMGKMPASDDDISGSDSDEGDEIEEFVVCTLDPHQHYQQPLDLTIGDGERVFFKVTGTHTIFLTGNYIVPEDEFKRGMYDSDSDEDADYDMESDLDDSESLDELDDMADPRVTELSSEDEPTPALVKAQKKSDSKSKNKRPAEDSADEENLDEMITKEKQATVTVNGEQKLSKKQLKKMKKNDGKAVAVVKVEEKDETPSAKSDKKVQFAKELEQGPTPAKGGKEGKDKPKANAGEKVVQGVVVDDRKVGTGPAAKNGDRVSMRYIGKLKDNMKVFDSNKKGKPFAFKLGAGDVIKGWEIGIQGIQVGGERRLTIPARLAYGSKGAPPDIPKDAALIFDIKVLEIKGGK